MKKLLLSALLAASATSFAGITVPVVTGNESALLPIVVKGNVIEATKLTMEVTALDNAGPDGRSMTFNFGDLVKGISKEDLVGTFRVRLLKKATSSNDIEEHKFDKEPKYTLIGGAEGTGADSIGETNTTTTNGVKLKYVLGAVKGVKDVTRNEEKLTVSADASNYSSVSVGQFTDSSVKVKITLDSQTTGKD